MNSRKVDLLLAAFCALTLSAASFCGEANKPDDAKAAFEAAYEKGAAAAIEKKWAEAEKQFDAALKALGDVGHPKKAVAQVLLNKAREGAKAQEKEQSALVTADELLKLKQWAEAEAAYKKAAETLGESERVKAGIAAAQAGAVSEKNADATAAKEAEKKKEAEAIVAKVKAESDEERKKSEDAKAARKKDEEERAAAKIKAEHDEAVELPEAVALDRDDWQKGAGSSCYWSGPRLYLEEGDEFYKKLLKKDFAVTVALEARMDHRSRISIELRPDKDSGGGKAKIIGWGSKDGSAPMIEVDKDVKGRGDAKPSAEQIELSFVRRDKKIEFYCNGKLVGAAWDSKLGQAYTLWVCGKGIMDRAKIVEK